MAGRRNVVWMAYSFSRLFCSGQDFGRTGGESSRSLHGPGHQARSGMGVGDGPVDVSEAERLAGTNGFLVVVSPNCGICPSGPTSQKREKYGVKHGLFVWFAKCKIHIAMNFEEAPLLVIWETTQACDLSCVHCRASAMPFRNQS